MKNGIHVNKMTFPRSKTGEVEVIDDELLASLFLPGQAVFGPEFFPQHIRQGF